MSALRRVRSGDVEIIIDAASIAPRIVYFGGVLDGDLAPALFDAPRAHGLFDDGEPIPIFPDPARGWCGTPGLDAPRLSLDPWSFLGLRDDAADRLTLLYARSGGLRLEVTFEGVGDTGVFAMRSVLICDGERLVDGAAPVCTRLNAGGLPLPGGAVEALVLTGRWAGEAAIRRAPLTGAGLVLESRAGLRASHAAFPGVVAGEAGFADDHGAVVGAHFACPSDWEMRLAPSREGRLALSAAMVGSLDWAQDGSAFTLATPALYVVQSDHGLNGLRARFQAAARRVAGGTSPPKVRLNTWEAVDFDHDEARLKTIASAAAALGVERFVLDDGWFGRRTDESRGLGDWTPRPEVYPNGLGPLMDHVIGQGMDFGLWVEPEMVSADSALFETHADWIQGRLDQPLGRNQYALDLSDPACADWIRGAMGDLVADMRIAALKWDANRDAPGAPQTHAAQTQMTMSALVKARAARGAPLDIEACASGGGRMDWSWLPACNRIWISDAHDPDIRMGIIEAMSVFLPPEIMGTHVGPETSRLTGRRFNLEARAAMAMLGSFGLELDPAALSDADAAMLKAYIAAWRARRDWMARGVLLALPHPDPGLTALGVFSHDRDRALICAFQRTDRDAAVPAPLRVRHLKASDVIVSALAPDRCLSAAAKRQPAWLDTPLRVRASALASAGLPLPILPPGRAVLIDIAPDAPDDRH